MITNMMSLRVRSACAVALFATVSACAAAGSQSRGVQGPVAQTSLKQFLDTLVDAPEFRSAQWGIIVVDPGKGETLYSRNADKLFMPASNMKLLTGSTALAQLGADYRWTTTLLARGAVRNAVLEGDLVVRGNGDPSISAHMQKGDALAPLRALADSLRAHGITRVRGRLVAAPSPFTDSPLGLGWAWDDLDEAYSAGVDALYFNEGFTEVIVRGGARAGDPVRVSTRPATTFPNLIVHARTIARGVKGDTAARTSIALSQDSSHIGVLVDGTIIAGDSIVREIAFRDQSSAYMHALREAFSARGIIVDDAATDSTARVDSIVSMRSPTLREVLPFFEKPSQNQIGELLFKTLALEKTGVGRADSASRVVSRQVIAWGAEADGFAIRDGSGLSRHDYVSPRTIIHVLDAVRKHPDFALFYDALPIAGVDGTVGSRMKGTPAAGNLHAKTGTLDKARSLSGYVTTADGHVLLFSALCNNYVVPTRRVDRVSDALGVYLASMVLAP
ncbi:MAG: D-alanyl-D-alanine carboxypeptidase/D-alanyl-D-alanine-endopeptidase [Gemmatimonadetes bacterium]|nr:D-alanyl-D-alanine carboxypeptidase/D-alanyl-D-alanine-endopeptidase [Gemmatimonadota bacterium]